MESDDFQHLMKYTDGVAKFPFYWAQKSEHKIDFDFDALTNEEGDILEFLVSHIKSINSVKLIDAANEGTSHDFLCKILAVVTCLSFVFYFDFGLMFDFSLLCSFVVAETEVSLEDMRKRILAAQARRRKGKKVNVAEGAPVAPGW